MGKPRRGGQCESLERLRLSAGFRRPHDNHRSGNATGRRVGRSEPCRGCAWVHLLGNALVHEIQKSAGPRACPTWSAVSWRFGGNQSPKQRSVLTCEPGWIFSSPLRTPLENVGGEIVVLEIVQAVLDHLASRKPCRARFERPGIPVAAQLSRSGYKAIVEIFVFEVSRQGRW